MHKRWTGLATTVTLVASLLALNTISGPAQAEVPAGTTWTVFAAGDVAKCDAPYDEATAAVIKDGIAADPDHSKVLMLGDGAYLDGSLQTYMDCYDKNGTGTGWGAFKDKTLPVPGNHDYGKQMSNSDAGYRQYWDATLKALNDAGGDTLKDQSGWYSTDIGNWHIIGLNWACSPDPTKGSGSGCKETDPQGVWLAGDLQKAKAANKHIIATWHSARFFSTNDNATPTDPTDDPPPSSDDAKTNAYWRMLQGAGADIVLGGHQHNYERFDHMSTVQPAGAPAGDAQGQVDPAGMRQFVVGTGGGALMPYSTPGSAVGSQARIDNSFGVLKLTLHENSYEWQFLSSGSPGEQPAGTPLDSGTDVTHSTIGGGGTTETTGTTGPGGATTTTTLATGPSGNRRGYWMVGADGKVYGFGTAERFGDAGLLPGIDAADLEPTPSGRGYWVVDSAGGVSSLGDAVYRGAPDSLTLKADEKVTSLSSTPTGKGYWMFTNKGRVLAYGDATSYGDMSKAALNGPVLDSIVTPTGKGYYMVASDGGIFAFGDAKFYGSMGGNKLNAPVQSLVPDSDGVGYWLVASDGGIFAFDSPFKGSMGDKKLNKPVTGMVRYADGYLMVGEDGGIFNFSSTDFLGSLGSKPPARPIVSVAALG
ncbi:MAG TPA: metallophosphoesterase [Acidimicrobiia bacterium]|nr:metallophosphoesterase [Acidimicrobiia bacterium]